ncbi:hypothetical protein B0T16DRAFT_394728 [Cercophora newfieldiana]|uniref:Uncharacterized protein n=1 Tax=Cercophora newfieldiana TaxID=92897 RepID=A0AA40CHW7_9PEZI|nr:hypothetical protein B0T16DRAFT_394728 [Cercophora newfieldiana]
MSQQSSTGIVSPPPQQQQQQKMPLPSRSRAQSISSDRPSTIAYSFMSPPLSVSPEAAFIATSAASQIVTNDHDSHADTWYDQHGVEPSGETAAVSPAALQLVNNFLDQLLFNFLSIARSTSLSALRPAVSEVLKPKLAKDAINQADEELREYLGGDDEDVEPSPTPISPRDWDLELAWKRTRLRCMVYSSLGDMEEEDEDFYMEQEHLTASLEDRQSEVVSPAVAIFLTSILEFMGEQALIVAGQASYHRMRLRYEKELKDGTRSPSEPADRVLVEELDMERVALDRTLGRLWRAWKKKIRSPGITTMDQRLSRSYSKDSMRGGSGHLRSPSSITGEPSVPTVPEPLDEGEVPPIEEWELVEEPESFEEYLVAASIPLPIGERDVDEIEVPGLAYYSDDETEADESEEDLLPPRPKSLAVFSLGGYELSAITLAPASTFRKRSNSVPNATTAPFFPRVPLEETDDDEAEDDDVGDVVEILDKARPAAQASDGKSPKSPKGGWSSSEEEDSPIQSATMPASLQAVLAQVQEDEDEVLDEDEDVIIEEPQILMSSRISISGRSSSPATSERGKPAAINTNLPARTPSIHSARLVDVAGPRSPAVGSRRSSAEVDLIRQVTAVRLNGATAQTPLVEEKMRRSPDSMSAFRSGVKTGFSENSISEAEEISGINHDDAASPNSPTGSSAGIGLAVIPEPVVKQPARSSFGPFPKRTQAPPAPPSPVKTTVTKVTIISSTASNGPFNAQQGRPEPPRKPAAAQTRPQPTTPTNGSFASEPPAVPERNTVRKQSTSSPRGSPQQPSTIGQVSVERRRTRSPSEPYPPRTHESPSQATRQQHTSGSTSSTSTNRLKPVRTSEETTRSRIDVARDFEQLIHSDQTIQYTLTPENMRDMDSQSNRSGATGSPVVAFKTRRSEEARQNGDRSRSSSFIQSNELKRSSSISQSTPTPDYQRKNSLGIVPSNVSNSSGAGSRSAPSVPAKSRANGPIPQARDARLPRESVAELADFLRSTGPGGGGMVRTTTAPASVSKSSVDTPRASTTSSIARARLQARDAAVDYKDDNSDLIDFIRRGPPSAAGNPRIPRTVAPFRTTMDSDQLAGAVGGRAVDAQLRDVDVRSSQASTNITESSMQSSVNSQSALLGRNKALPGGNRGYGGGDDDMPIPQRKTRRVRDPYAIDLSDEDEDDDMMGPGPQRKAPPQEESLLDFLRSMPPPPPEPVAPQPISRPKKKASAPSLMARLTRRGESGRNSNSSSGNSSPRSPVPPPVAEPRSSGVAGGAKGYIPIQVNMPPGVDKYNPSNFRSTAPSVGAAPPATRRVPMKKFEPRDPVAVSSRGTSELAEFFKNSAPPGGPVGRRDDSDYPPRYPNRKKTSVAG